MARKPYPEVDSGEEILPPYTGEVGGNLWRPGMPPPPIALTPSLTAPALGPVGSFNQETLTGQNQYRLALPVVSKASDLAPAPTVQAPTSTGQPYYPPLNPKQMAGMGYGSAVLSGLGAGSQVQPTRDAGSAVLQAVGAGAGGAADGAIAGATIGALGGHIGAVGGAVVGGITGLVSGGIQSYLGLRSARAEKREADRIYKEITEREEKRYQQQRADALQAQAQGRADQQENQRYNRRAAALQAQWAAQQQAAQKIRTLIQDDETLKQLFIRDAR